MTILAWLLAAMSTWLPPRSLEDSARYARIATDVEAVAFDEDEPPLDYRGDDRDRRARTALLLLAIARYESDYRADVDEGKKRGLAGDSCILQIVFPRGRTMELEEKGAYRWVKDSNADGWGIGVEDVVPGSVVGRRRNCVRAGLRLARESFRICRSLSLYASGSCKPDVHARRDEELARSWWRTHPVPARAETEALARSGDEG